jgi:aminodeoxyfutalosine deaminase
MLSLERLIYSADAVYNGVGLPLLDAGVLVSRAGETETIIMFGKLTELRAQFPDTKEVRAGRAILPPPVNAHTHLDMTRFPFSRAPYFDWIPQAVIANRELRGLEGAGLGIGMLQEAGTGAFGDIVARASVMEWLLESSPLPGVAYWEIIGSDPARTDEILLDTREKIRAWKKLEREGGVRVGLSPHTAHTVSAKLLRGLTELSRLEGLPMQIHIAEHPSELEWFRTGGGPLAGMLAGIPGVPDATTTLGRAPDAALTPVKHLAEIGMLDAKPTLVHAVNVTPEDVRTIAQYGCSVVSCPRSNRNLSCGVFPWALYAQNGVEVGLGTDSIASGETLSVRDEALAALEIHGAGFGLRNAVRWAVKGGYKALGMKTPVIARGDDFSRLTVWE